MLNRLALAVTLAAVGVMLVAPSFVVAKDTDSGMALAGIGASPQPDLFTGTLTTSIPIDVPSGRNGVHRFFSINLTTEPINAARPAFKE